MVDRANIGSAMAYVLIPGAGGRAWYWHLIASRLSGRGHSVTAVELPADDDSKGLSDYAQTVLDVVARRAMSSSSRHPWGPSPHHWSWTRSMRLRSCSSTP